MKGRSIMFHGHLFEKEKQPTNVACRTSKACTVEN